MNGSSGRLRLFKDWGEFGVDSLAERGNEGTAGLNAVAQLHRLIVHLREGLPCCLHIAIHTRQTFVRNLKCLRYRIGNIGHAAACWSIGGPYANQR